MKLLEETYAGYVNLDKRTDRRQRMEQSLAAAGITAVRHRGMLPSEYTGDPARIKGMWERPQKGAIGCHFSQVGVMRQALVQGKHALVMEDDLVFCSDFQERLEHIQQFMEEYGWDVFWLGGTFHVNPPYWHKKVPDRNTYCQPLGRDAERVDDFPRIMRTFGCFCTYAYFVNRDSIEKILQRFEDKLPKSIGIDHMMIMLQPELFTYAFVPGCIKQYDHQSDIGHGITRFSNFATLNKTCKCPDPATCPHGKDNLARSAYWWADKQNDFNPETFNWNEAG